MLEDLEVLEIQVMAKQGKKFKQIARETGYSINTVRKYARDRKLAVYTKRPDKMKKLDNFKDYLKYRIEQASPNWIPATVLFREICELGYKGSISLLRAFLHDFKPKIKERPLIRFETDPGEQMQVDFASFKFLNQKFYAFVAVLGYSRMSYIEFVPNQKINNVISCHENAFNYFSGVPKNGLYDNMKTIIIKRNAYGKGKHKLHNSFYDFAKHYGFIPTVCKPYNPQTKGKVERMISYLRYSFYVPFIAGKEQICLDELNVSVLEWLNNTANQRKHATTNEEPFFRWELEKEYLLNIPVNYTSNYGVNKTVCAKDNRQLVLNQGYPIQHELQVYESLSRGLA